MSSICALVTVSILGAIAIIVGAVLGFKVLPEFVDEEVKKSVYLEEGTEQYERWEELPFGLTFKVYVFDVQNPEEIMKNEKPILVEKGPYIYRQYRFKQNITYFKAKKTYNYRQIQKYEFDAEASAPLTEDDVVTVLNSPKYGAIEIGAALSAFVNGGINNAFKDSQDTLFHTIKVRDYFFGGYQFCKKKDLAGFTRTLCTNIRKLGAKMKNMEFFDDYIQFSFFRFKNNTDDGMYDVHSGISDVMQTGQIAYYDGADHLGIWGDPDSTCNAVNGTDSSIFAPFNDHDTVLKVFSSDICRSVTLNYQEDVEYKGITGQRSTMRKDTFATPSDYQVNECFCINKTSTLENKKTCLPSGFLDMMNCLATPVVVSLPHFLWADEEYQKTVEGLEPDVEQHSTFVDLEPKTGTPLRGAKRIQFNMVMRQIPKITVTAGVSTAMMPILWIDEGVELPDELIDKLNEDYFSKLPMIEGLKWGLIVVGIAAIVISFLLYLCVYRKK